jgi:HSP20 family protein
MSLARQYGTVATWDPFREFHELSHRLNRAFHQAAGEGGQQALTGFDWVPSVNISETDKAYLVKADLPEVKKDEVKITHDAHVLMIEGERKREQRSDNEKVHRVEVSYGRFVRRFTLPEDADGERIEATFKDGVLAVTIPKVEVKKPQARQIPVG